MSMGSLILFAFIIYLLFVVTKSITSNYYSNKDIEIEEQKLSNMEEEISSLKNQIAYYRTATFKDREAREKLGYRAAGENVLILPIDKNEEKSVDSGLVDVMVEKPNYILWWEYFFG